MIDSTLGHEVDGPPFNGTVPLMDNLPVVVAAHWVIHETLRSGNPSGSDSGAPSPAAAQYDSITESRFSPEFRLRDPEGAAKASAQSLACQGSPLFRMLSEARDPTTGAVVSTIDRRVVVVPSTITYSSSTARCSNGNSAEKWAWKMAMLEKSGVSANTTTSWNLRYLEKT